MAGYRGLKPCKLLYKMTTIRYSTCYSFFFIEFEIPDDQVLLSDFDVWYIVLNNGLISEKEEEDTRQEVFFDSLSPEAQKEYREKNWERVLTSLRSTITGSRAVIGYRQPYGSYAKK